MRSKVWGVGQLDFFKTSHESRGKEGILIRGPYIAADGVLHQQFARRVRMTKKKAQYVKPTSKQRLLHGHAEAKILPQLPAHFVERNAGFRMLRLILVIMKVQTLNPED